MDTYKQVNRQTCKKEFNDRGANTSRSVVRVGRCLAIDLFIRPVKTEFRGESKVHAHPNMNEVKLRIEGMMAYIT